ncbi:helix-turn-helix domain-containing protein [Eubacterium sp.]|uniref:helix-turn-helix domain-containing protein n=1 Tax=Eubacterium sp. TaxID=142586 RepID=UPI002FC5E386
MNNSGENVYRKCRKESGLSTKEAAPLIGVQERTLRGYECFIYGVGGACPPEEVVFNMARVYGTLEVVYRHVSENTLLGRLLIPNVDFDENMALAYLKHQKELSDLSDKKLIESIEEAITNDGVITPDEYDVVNQFSKELKEQVSRGAALLALFQKTEKNLLEQALV